MANRTDNFADITFASLLSRDELLCRSRVRIVGGMADAIADEPQLTDHARRRIRAIIVAALIVLVAVPAFLYLGDAVVLSLRMARGGGQQTLTVYFATRLKSGKLEIFTDRPQTEVCAQALFPHFGYRPCWYVRRTGNVKVI